MDELEIGQVAFLAECYVPGITAAQVERVIADLRESVAAGGAAGQVRCLGSLFVPSDEVVFHLFAAPSAHAVRAVCEQAGLVCERIAHSIGLSTTAAREAVSLQGEVPS
jgi:hypothetical protein